MYGFEQKCEAMGTYLRFDRGIADTVAELGNPNRHALHLRAQDHKKHGGVRRRGQARDPKYTEEKRRSAVGHHPSHGRSPAGTMGAMGYPGGRECLRAWIGRYAPGGRKLRRPGPGQGPPSLERKMEAVAALEARGGTAAGAADGYGASGRAPCRWRRQPLSGDNASEADACAKGEAVSARCDEPPSDAGGLGHMAESLQGRVRRPRPELDVRQATPGLAKKRPGHRPEPAGEQGEGTADQPAQGEVGALRAAAGRRHGKGRP